MFLETLLEILLRTTKADAVLRGSCRGVLSKVDIPKTLEIYQENSPMVKFTFSESIGSVLAVFIEIIGTLFLSMAIFLILT